MAHITYHWQAVVPGFFANDLHTPGAQAGPAIAGLHDGSFFGVWDEPGASLSLEGRVVDSTGTPQGNQFQVNSTSVSDQSDSSIAVLNNGIAIVTFTDTSADSGDIRARRFMPDGTAVDVDFGISTSGSKDSNSDVVALSNGHFAVVWQRDFGGNDNDIRMAIFEADGEPLVPTIAVQIDAALNTNSPSVGALKGGNSVVAWEQSPVAGGDPGVWFQRVDSTGGGIGDAIEIDSYGANTDIQVAGLKDGGFVVAYSDSGWGLSGTEITVKFFNASGTERSGFLRANHRSAGDQTQPSLTVMSNGDVVVGWNDQSSLVYQAFDQHGNVLGKNYTVASGIVDLDIAAMSGGLIGNLRSSTFADSGGDQSMRGSVEELVRTTIGGGGSETLTGDILRDIMTGKGGADTLKGAGGRDLLNAGAGDDTLIGGSGIDRLTGGNGKDTLTGGTDHDRFIFAAVSDSSHTAAGADVIRDFHHDTIDVHGIDANTGHGGNQAFDFIGAAAFNAPGQVRAFHLGADTIIAFNTTGNSGTEMEIRLHHFSAHLHASDFDL